MKKLLTILSSFSLVSFSGLLAVSCVQKDNSGLEQTDPPYDFYKLNDDYFITPKSAVSDVLGVQATKREIFNSENKLFLGEKEYYSMENMYRDIYSMYDFNSLTTSRNPEDYLIDANGRLANSVVTDDLKTVEVYKDANGQAVFADDSINSNAGLDLVKTSYENTIKQKFYTDEQTFSTNDDIRSYMRNLYQSQESLNAEKVFFIGNDKIAMRDLPEWVENNSSVSYFYDGKTIDSSNIRNLNNFDLSNADLSKINLVHETPGYFYLNPTDKADDYDGQLSAPAIIQSTTDFASFVTDVNNWQKVDSSSSSALDLLLSGIISFITGSIPGSSNLLDDSSQIIGLNSTSSIKYDDFDILKVIKNYTNDDSEVDYFNALIHNYELIGDLSLLTNGLNLTDLEYSQKVNILMFKFSETLRTRNVSDAELDHFRELSKIIFNKRSSEEGWQGIVEKIAQDDVLNVWQYLIDSAFYKQSIPKSSAQELVELEKAFIGDSSLLNVEVEGLKNVFDGVLSSSEKALENLDKTLPTFEESVKAIEGTIKQLKSVLKILGWVGLALTILDSISLEESETYQLIIPNKMADKEQIISYTVKHSSFVNYNFDPAQLFGTVSILDPIAEERYVYNGLYFTTQEDVQLRVKRDILEDLTQNGKATYTSREFPGLNANSLQELTAKVESKVESTAIDKYLDHFGNAYDSPLEAYGKLDETIANASYPMVYEFEYNGKTYVKKTFEEAKATLFDLIEFEKKTVFWTDLYQTTKFDELIDANYFKYNIVSLKFRDQLYYFTDEWQAVNFVLKQSNYKNINAMHHYYEYVWNGMTFENGESLEKYVLEHLEKITLKTKEEVEAYVSKI